MDIYSCRAECEHDVGVFIEHLDDLKCEPLQVNYLGMTEWAIEFKSSLPIEQIRKVLATENDTHVMIQTLRALPLDKNNLSRDRNVDWDSEATIDREEVISFPEFSKKIPATCKVDVQTGRDYDNRDRSKDLKPN